MFCKYGLLFICSFEQDVKIINDSKK
ncbi:uncharacterized protein METZ01_LOCUS30480 [marine metagenome]|uniref:Uncharacterized protein n=1 Tax=marine metagenome TaxID=408172 RepID=A0A381QEB7_9ZZZZ